MDGLVIRTAGPGDSRFLREMLVEAANWSGLSPRSPVAVLDDPAVARYIAQWPRPGDIGLVCDDPHGAPVGACWARLFAPDAPGSAFIASGVPEVTLGVNPQWRSRGVGRELLRRMHAAAASAGYSRLSLSVDRSNFAQRLYASEGYLVVASDERADVMVKALA